MPGHNHYQNCSCGWCINYGYSGFTKLNAKSHLNERDAKRLLKENKANEHASTCFVNPNAECPVCKESVFFYANTAGSRVYFNELGPPWEKHGCTDNSLNKNRLSPTKIKPRSRGSRIELIQASETLGYLSKVEPSEKEVWRLVVVNNFTRNGFENTIRGEFLDQGTATEVEFLFTSSDEIISEQDVLTISETTLSLIHPKKLKRKDYKIRELKISNLAQPNLT